MAQCFAIERNDLTRVLNLADGLAMQLLCPGQKAVAECFGIKTGKDAPEGVMAGNAVRQRQVQVFFEPRLFGLAKAGDVHKSIGPADNGAKSNHQNVEQFMALGGHRTRIRQGGKMFGNKERHQQPPREDALPYHKFFLYAIALRTERMRWLSARTCVTM